MGYVFATSACYGCKRIFNYNPNLVPSVRINGVRELIAMDPKALVKGFDHFAAPAGEILARMREGLMDRINRHDLSYRRGRKFDSDYQRSMIFAARLLNQPRLIIDWLPPDLKERFASRLRVNCA